jgi:hypothetical protein
VSGVRGFSDEKGDVSPITTEVGAAKTPVTAPKAETKMDTTAAIATNNFFIKPPIKVNTSAV